MRKVHRHTQPGYSSAFCPLKVVVKAAVLQVFRLTLAQAQNKRWDLHESSQSKGEPPPPPCFGSWLPLYSSPCSHLALTLLRCKHWSLTCQSFPAEATAVGRQDQEGSGLCFFQDDPWNAELAMLLASASKEASQEQNVFYLSISNWSGTAFTSTLCQHFFEHQTGLQLSNSDCRASRLKATASGFWLQALLMLVTSHWLYITHKVFPLWMNFHHWDDQNRVPESNSNRLRGSLNLPKPLRDDLTQMNSEHIRTDFNYIQHLQSGETKAQILCFRKINSLQIKSTKKKEARNLQINRIHLRFLGCFPTHGMAQDTERTPVGVWVHQRDHHHLCQIDWWGQCFCWAVQCTEPNLSTFFTVSGLWAAMQMRTGHSQSLQRIYLSQLQSLQTDGHCKCSWCHYSCQCASRSSALVFAGSEHSR